MTDRFAHDTGNYLPHSYVKAPEVFEETPAAEIRYVKQQLVEEIDRELAHRELTQWQAANLLGVPQSKISLLRNGKVHGFSMEKLCALLQLMGRDVTISLSPAPEGTVGRLRLKNET